MQQSRGFAFQFVMAELVPAIDVLVAKVKRRRGCPA